MIRWDDVPVFLAVARHGELGPAGKALGLGAAAVSERVGALEVALGATLFERSGTTYGLTEAGRGLVAHAEAMERHALEAAEAVAGDGGRLSGKIRIGAPDGVSNYLLIEACDALSAENPALQIQAVALPRMFSLSTREADVAITVAPPSASRMTVRKIADYDLHLYVQAKALARIGPVRCLEDLRELRGIGYVSDMIVDRELDNYALLGREADPALTSNSLIMQLRWCRRGAGICILPDFIARAHPDLAIVLPEEIELRRAFYLVRHEDDARVPRINRIAEVIVDHMRRALEAGSG